MDVWWPVPKSKDQPQNQNQSQSQNQPQSQNSDDYKAKLRQQEEEHKAKLRRQKEEHDAKLRQEEAKAQQELKLRQQKHAYEDARREKAQMADAKAKGVVATGKAMNWVWLLAGIVTLLQAFGIDPAAWVKNAIGVRQPINEAPANAPTGYSNPPALDSKGNPLLDGKGNPVPGQPVYIPPPTNIGPTTRDVMMTAFNNPLSMVSLAFITFGAVYVIAQVRAAGHEAADGMRSATDSIKAASNPDTSMAPKIRRGKR